MPLYPESKMSLTTSGMVSSTSSAMKPNRCSFDSTPLLNWYDTGRSSRSAHSAPSWSMLAEGPAVTACTRRVLSLSISGRMFLLSFRSEVWMSASANQTPCKKPPPLEFFSMNEAERCPLTYTSIWPSELVAELWYRMYVLVLANSTLPRTARLLPQRNMPRRDNEEPMLAQSQIETDAPRRLKLRTESDAPKWKKSITDSEEPRRIKLRTDMDEPRWVKSRTDIVEPRRMKSRLENVDPSRAQPKTENAEPTRHKVRSDSVDPM
mmetsp:Transcript_71908/g.185476  ORF Transcript_71908/g.185476 Transcript_71908/m.185476 type:complete len:265 (-) Transcript_71908:238-1032(-)